MKQVKEKEYEEFQQCLYNKAHGYIWTPDTLELICGGNDNEPERIGKQVGAVWTRIMNDYGHVDDETPSFAISLYKEYRGQGIGSQLMVKMLELLKWQGYERASLAVQKANYAVKMYKKVGFKTVEENAEEYIMVCEL